MEPIYVMAISVFGAFIFLLLVYYLIANLIANKEEKKRKEIDNAYKPENLKKMEYDLAFYDEETAIRIISGKVDGEKQVTIDDLIASGAKNNVADEITEDAILNKIGNDEGMEEITGHYKPD